MKQITAFLTVLILGGTLGAEPVSVLGASNPVNLAAGQTGLQALAGGSGLTFGAGATDGGFDLLLSAPMLLGKVQLTLSGIADVHFQAISGSQTIDLWSRSQGGLYDLSGNLVVTDHLRVSVQSPSLPSVTISNLQVFGDNPSTLSHRIFPTNVQATGQSSFFYGPQNLFDGNSSTDWKVYQPQDSDSVLPDLEGLVRGAWTNWWQSGSFFDVRALATLPAGQTIAQVQVYFGPQEAGTVEIQALVSGSWKSWGTLNTSPSSWGTLVNPSPNDQIQQIQIIQHTSWFAPVQADIGEVYLWGTGAASGDSYQDPVLAGTDSSGNQYQFFSWGNQSWTGDLYAPNSPAPSTTVDPTNPPAPAAVYYEFAIANQGSALPSAQLNGHSLGSPAPYLTEGEVSYYKVPVPQTWLSVGENMFLGWRRSRTVAVRPVCNAPAGRQRAVGRLRGLLGRRLEVPSRRRRQSRRRTQPRYPARKPVPALG